MKKIQCFAIALISFLCLQLLPGIASVQAQIKCGFGASISAQANIVSVFKCIPYAQVRIVYSSLETGRMFRDDVWTLNMGDGQIINYRITADGTVPRNPDTRLTYGVYAGAASSTNPYGGQEYHAYTYTLNSASCLYRVTLNATRDCPPLNSTAGDVNSVTKTGEVPIFALDTDLSINNEPVDKIFLCEGADFDRVFQSTSNLNCTNTTLINTPGYNGDFASTSTRSAESEHRGPFWQISFQTFTQSQRDDIRIRWDQVLGTDGSYVVTSKSTGDQFLTATNSATGIWARGATVRDQSDFPTARVTMPAQSTLYYPNQGQMRFTVRFTLTSNYCIREYGRVDTYRKALGLTGVQFPNVITDQSKTLTYDIINGPDPPTVASNTIYHCIGTAVPLGVTATDPNYTLVFYEKQGNNAATLNTITRPSTVGILGNPPVVPSISPTPTTTKNYVAAGSVPVSLTNGTFSPNLTSPGVYTYYVVQEQKDSVTGFVCRGEAAVIEVIALPSLPRPNYTAPTTVCTYGQLRLDAGAAPADVMVPVITTGITPVPAANFRTIQTEYVWTLPNGTSYSPVSGAGGAVANHTTRNSVAVFNVSPAPGATSGSNPRNVVLTRQYTGTSPSAGIPDVLCPSPTNAQTFTETFIAASVDDDGDYCFGQPLNVELSGYIPNRDYNITFIDNFGNTYAANNVALNAVNTTLPIIPTAGGNIRVGSRHDITITRLAILDAGGREECVNTTAATLGDTGGGALALPELLGPKVAGTAAVPDTTVCPGESYVITLPNIPPAQLGGNTVRASVIGLNNNFDVNVDNDGNTITVTPRVRPSNLSSAFTVRRELTPANCVSVDNNYYINVSTMPFARLETPTPKLIVVCNGEQADVTFTGFEGQNLTTNNIQVDIEVRDDTKVILGTETYSMTTPGRNTRETRQLPLRLQRSGVDVFVTITAVREVPPAGATVCTTTFASANPPIAQTPVRVRMRPDLSFSATIGTYNLNGGNRRNFPLPGRTDYIPCAYQRNIGFKVLDATGNIVPAPMGAEYVWDLPPSWVINSKNADNSEITVHLGNPSPGLFFTVARRYSTSPTCQTRVITSARFILNNAPSLPVITPANPSICGANQTVTFSTYDLPVGNQTRWLVPISPSRFPDGSRSYIITGTSFTRNAGTAPIPNTINMQFRKVGSYTLRVEVITPIVAGGVGCNVSIFNRIIVVRPITASTIRYPNDFAGPDQDVCGLDNTGNITSIQLAGEAPQTAIGHTVSWKINNYTPQGLLSGGNPVVVTPTTNPATNLVLATFDDNTKFDAVMTIGNGQYGRYELEYTIDAGCTTLVRGGRSAINTVIIDSKMPITIDDLNVAVTAAPGTTLGTISRIADPNEVSLCIAEGELSNGIDLSGVINGPLQAGTGGGTWTTLNGGGTFSMQNATDRTVQPAAPLTAANRAVPVPPVTEHSVRYTPVVADYGKAIVLQLQANPEAGYPCNYTVLKTIRVTINRSPTVNVQDLVICNGDDFEFNFTSDIATGVNYDWEVQMIGRANTALPYPFNAANTTATVSNSGNIARTTLNNPTTTAYRATLTVTAMSGGCVGPGGVYNITLLPSFSVSIPTASSICSGGGDFALNIPRASYSTVVDETGARVPIKLEFTVEDYGNDAAKRGNFNTPPTAQIVQTAIPADINDRFTNTGNPNYGAPHTFVIPGAQLELTNTASSAQTININIRTYVDHGSTATPATKCYGPSYTYQLTVAPIPVITAPTARIVVCDGDTLNLHNSITTQLSVADVAFSWRVQSIVLDNTNNAVAAAVSSAPGVQSATISQVMDISNTLAAPGNVAKSHVTMDYRVTPHYAGTAACVGIPINFSVVVLPKPLIAPLAAKTVCSLDGRYPTSGVLQEDLTITNIGRGATITADPPAVSYSYDIPTSTSYTATRMASSPRNEINVRFTSDVNNTTPVTVPVTITPTYTATILGTDYTCGGDVVTHNVTLLPIVRITNIDTDFTICDNSAFQFTPTHSITTPTAPIAYSWSWVAAPGIVPKVSNNGGPGTALDTGVAINNIIDFPGALTAPEVVTYTITPWYDNGITPAGGRCGGTPFRVTVRVIPSPFLTTNTVYNDACSGPLVFEHGNVANNSQRFSVDPATATINWTVTDTNAVGEVTGYAPAGSGAFNFNVVNNTATSKDITITFTPTLGVAPNVCTGNVITKTITIAPGPTTNNVNLDVPVCSLNSNAGVVAATANNIDYQITPSAAVPNMSYEYAATITNTISGAVETTGVSVYNAAGTGIAMAATATGPHFTHTTTGLSVLGSTVGGSIIESFRLKVVNTNNHAVFLNVAFNAVLAGGICKGATFNVRFNVQPIPTVSNVPALTAGAGNTDFHFEVCSGETFSFTPASGISDNTLRFRFTNMGNRVGSPGTAMIVGVPPGVGVFDRDPATTLTDTFTFTPTFVGTDAQYLQLNMQPFFNNASGVNCDGPTEPLYVKILPMPTVALHASTRNVNAGDIIVCSGERFEIFVDGMVDNTTYNWTASDNVNVGLDQAVFSPNNYVKSGTTGVVPLAATVSSIFSGTLTHRETTEQQVDYIITPSTSKSSGANCVGTAPLTVRVLVQPIARITNAPVAAVEVCSGATYNFMPNSSVTGVTYRWELINNSGSNVTIASSNTPTVEHGIADATANPAIALSGTTSIVQTGTLNHIFRNTSRVRAVLRFNVYPVHATAIGGKVCDGTPVEVTLNVEPNAVAGGGTVIDAIDHGADYNYDPAVAVNGVTYDWRAVIPGGITINDSAGVPVTSQSSVSSLALRNISNTNNDVRTISFSITPRLPGSTCTGTLIRVDLHVLPNIVLTLSPTGATTICADDSMNLLIQDNVTTANTDITHTYDWAATAIGTNVREVTLAPRAEAPVEVGATNVPKTNIGSVGTKRLTITTPEVNIATETVTYTFTTRIVYSYTNAAGPQTIRSADRPSSVTYSVVPTPVTSDFLITTAAGTTQNAGNTICRGQIVTYQFDVTPGSPNGTIGNSYSVTTTTDAGSLVANAPVISVNGNRALVRYNNVADWGGTLRVVETSSVNGCRGAEKTLIVRTIAAPVANAGTDITICSGNNVTLGRPDTAGGVANTTTGATIPGALYRWEPPFFLVSQAGNSFDVDHPVVSPTQTTTYRLVVSVPNGCSSVEDTVVVTVAPTPSKAVISGPVGTLCENENYVHRVAGGTSTFTAAEVVLTASVSASTTGIVWYRTSTQRTPMAVDIISSRTSPTLQLSVSNPSPSMINDTLIISGSANNGFYYAQAVGPTTGTAVGGVCSPAVSDAFRVNFVPNPARPVITVTQGTSNDNFLCSSGTESITLEASGGYAAYKWYYFNPAGATGTATSEVTASLVAGANTSRVILSRPLQSGFYGAVGVDASGCEGPLSLYQEVIILRKLTTPWITTSNPSSLVCENGSITLTSNLSELLATPPTVAAGDVEFVWMQDPDRIPGNGDENIITAADGSSALATSNPTPFTGASITIPMATTTNQGNYTLVARRRQATRNAYTVGGNVRAAGTTLYCPSTESRALFLTVVGLPPTPDLSIPTATVNPFCGDKGATKSLIINATHPASTVATPVPYPASVTFKWERKNSHADPDTSYVVVPGNATGTNRLALTSASESGVYRVRAEIITGSSVCADAAAVYPASTAMPVNTITIYDSPKRVSLTPSKTILCFSDRLGSTTGVRSNFIAVDESDATIYSVFTVELEVSIPDPDNPADNTLRTTRTFTQTYTTTATTPSGSINLNNPADAMMPATPPATGMVPVVDLFQNNSGVNAIYRFTVLSVLDGNGCSPPTLPAPFEVTVLPSPQPTEIRTGVTSSGQPAATIDTTAAGARRVVVCGDGTKIVRFEIDPVAGSSYAWGFFTEDFAKDATLSQNLTKAGFYTYVRGGSSADTYVEVRFEGGSMANNPIRTRVTDGTTGCVTIKELDVTIFGPVLAKAGDDYSICPENVRTNPTLSMPAILSVNRRYVQLGNNNNISVANITPGKQAGSGTYTYLWEKVTTAGSFAIPASEFQAGSVATDEKPFVSPTATSTYVVTVTDTGAGCSTSEDKITVYVFPKPTIGLSQTVVGICETGTATATLGPVRANGIARGTDGALPAGSIAPTPALVGEYEYICENCNDTTGNPAVHTTGGNWVFDRDRTQANPSRVSKIGTYNVTVLYRDPRGCSESLVGSLTVEVYPLPTISITPVAAVCLNTPAFRLDGGMISGIPIPASVTPSAAATLNNNEYKMSGAGVTLDAANNAFMFDPSVAGVSAAHDITYTYRDNSGCEATPLIIPIRVKELPNVSIAARGSTGSRFNFGVCEGQGAGNRGYQLSEGRLTPAGAAVASAITGTDLAGVEYSGPGVSADATTAGTYYFNASIAGVGSHTLTFSYTDQNAPAGEISCKNSVDYRVEVWPAPTISFPDLADVSKCAPLFNLTTATASPDLTVLNDVPGQPEGFYRDVIAITRGVTEGYDLTTPAAPTPGNTALVIRQVDATNQTIAFQIDPRRSISTVGTHLLRYDYKDGFGCENVVPATAKLKIVPPPSPTLTPKDPKDTNPIVADRKPFSAVCPSESPFEITGWGSTPPTGGSGVYETADSRMSRLITTRSVGGVLQYWFEPTELFNLSANLVDLSRAFSINIRYTVTDSSGCSGFDTQPILITPVPSGTISAAGDNCNGSPLEFRMNQQGYAPFLVEYYDILKSNNPFKIQAGHLHRVKVEPSLTTIYRIRSITDANGCVNYSPARSQATISATPNAAFKPDPITQTIPNKTVTFVNESNSEEWVFNWEFGDGTRINGSKSEGTINITHADGSTTQGSYVTPVHTYRRDGVYNVVLRATGGNCDATATNVVTIEARVPTVDFTANKLTGCAPLEVVFTNLSKFVNNDDYLWTFGESTGKSSSINPTFTFTKPGTYRVTLVGSSAVGGPITTVKDKYITVFAQPDARFTLDPRTVYLPTNPVKTSNLSFGATEYEWDFGDGTTSTEVEPVHIYKKGGQYDITLKAVNALTGCTDEFTISNAVTALEEGKIEIPNVFTPDVTESSLDGVRTSVTTGHSPSDNSVNNNVFLPIVSQVVKFDMQIFNRWGELLFISKSQSVGWNGYYKGKLVPTGTYVYKISIEFTNGKRIEKMGDISVIR